MVTTSISERPRPSRATPLPVRRLVSSPPAGQVCSAVPRRSRTKCLLLGSRVAASVFGINDNNALGFDLILPYALRLGVMKSSPAALGREASACVSMAGRGDCDTEKCIGYIFQKGQCNVNVGFFICCAQVALSIACDKCCSAPLLLAFIFLLTAHDPRASCTSSLDEFLNALPPKLSHQLSTPQQH